MSHIKALQAAWNTYKANIKIKDDEVIDHVSSAKFLIKTHSVMVAYDTDSKTGERIIRSIKIYGTFHNGVKFDTGWLDYQACTNIIPPTDLA